MEKLIIGDKGVHKSCKNCNFKGIVNPDDVCPHCCEDALEEVAI